MIVVLGKLVWFVAAPSNFLLILLTASLLLTLVWRGARWLVAVVMAVLLFVTLFPVGKWLDYPLEARFAVPDPRPEHVDGIIVLGGGASERITRAWGQPALGETAERFTAFIELSRIWPKARLAFSGGLGPLIESDITEADVVRDFLGRLGFDVGRVTFESRSRNTRENALFSLDLLKPRAGETWLLVTSAMHMPRAIGCFRAVGFPVAAWPVDYRTDPIPGARWRWLVGERLAELDNAMREWVGLAWYHLMGWTSSSFPSP